MARQAQQGDGLSGHQQEVPQPFLAENVCYRLVAPSTVEATKQRSLAVDRSLFQWFG